MLVVVIFNFKGGTGKSTMALNLGTCLADNAKRTLLVDLDGQRTLSYALGLDGSKPTALDWLTEDVCTSYWTSHLNLSLIPGDIGLFKLQSDQNLLGEAICKLNNTFDVVLLDCPPSLSLTSVHYRLLHTTIPDNISIAESIAAKRSVISYMVNSAGARAYQSLAKECQKLWGLS
jgi:chromosome partitioning protein